MFAGREKEEVMEKRKKMGQVAYFRICFVTRCAPVLFRFVKTSSVTWILHESRLCPHPIVQKCKTARPVMDAAL
jgi:hypothetical protein